MHNLQCSKFFSTTSTDAFMLTTLCSGMAPYNTLFNLIIQALLMLPLKLISFFYLYYFEKASVQCKKDEEEKEKIK